MENASKALIIAASILIAIMIVAMGVMVFNKAQNSGDMTSLDAAEINMFNSKFERYSDDQLGSQVKSLISFAISNASTNKTDPSKLPTVIHVGGTTATGNETVSASDAAVKTYINQLSSIRNEIISTHTYKIKCEYESTGLIYQIKIED